MKRSLSLFLLGVVLMLGAGFGYDYWQRHRDPAEANAARLKAAAQSFLDPESVRWTNVRVSKDGSLCGQVNAKNKMGGYDGAHFFYLHDKEFRVLDVQTVSPDLAVSTAGLAKRALDATTDYLDALNGFNAHCVHP